ncbi:hypothetical protein AYO44_14780 [Planctomycetaceae bacterium SCGC AG-212-F19]|nr:hypothetical protein AYO44_14780 [Planctomycetaceae bacterium SCGC AG-212-F19]
MARRLLVGAGITAVVILASGLLAAPELGPPPKPENQLAKTRLEAARKAYGLVWQNYQEGLWSSAEDIYRWSSRWMEAERALATQKAQHVAACEAHFDRMRRLEKLVRDNYRVRVTTITVVSAAEYYAVEAEVWLAQVKNAP